MSFPTIDFALFFAAVYCLAWGFTPWPRCRKWLLIAGSYYFYAYWDWRFAVLLAECSLLNFLFGLLLSSSRSESLRKGVLAAGVVFNLSILGFFKYFDFFTQSANDLLLQIGMTPSMPVLELMLPVGISFFTFQGISYVVDVYRGDIKGSDSIGDVLLYISFFPQLVAGPIVRASCFMPQLLAPPNPNRIAASKCFFLIALGLFKKIVIANYLASEFVTPVYSDPSAYSSLEAWFAVYGYAVQLYCDFSAYSDIAIGLAGLLGYYFPENFNQPYKADSLQDFWRRWHISLSSWLKDYLYRPLGGSRRGEWITKRNLFLVMLLAGLWHGAAWTFAIFGIIHGVWLLAERALFKALGDVTKTPIFRFLSGVVTFHFVCFSLVFFAADSMTTAMQHLAALTKFTGGFTLLTPFTLTLILVGLIGNWVPKESVKWWWDAFAAKPVLVQAAVLGVLFLLLGAMGPEGIAPFIYYQF